jgi:hypothetical protein
LSQSRPLLQLVLDLVEAGAGAGVVEIAARCPRRADRSDDLVADLDHDASAEQGFTRPSKANQLAFERAVGQISKAAQELLDSLVTNAPPRYREVVAAKAQAKPADRFRVRPEKSPGA